MTRLAVDVDGLVALVERMQLFEAQLAGARSAAEMLERGLDGAWSGAASAARAAAHARWRTAAAEVAQALSDLRAIASGAHANYTAAVAANRGMWAL
jgi:uncharacterized protein YukE